MSSLRGLMEAASSLAQDLGHRIGPWAHDDSWSAFAFCAECSLAVIATSTVSDDGESPIYGSAAAIPCSHQPGSSPSWEPYRKEIAHASRRRPAA